MHCFAVIGKGEFDSPAAKIGDASRTPIYKFQMHHLTSLHGTEMLYNVEQLHEIIREYIVQEFKEFDEELISLHFKVEELTNHVAVLPKKLNRSGRTPVMVVRLKCHSIIVSMTQ
jgi:hypothetical protein